MNLWDLEKKKLLKEKKSQEWGERRVQPMLIFNFYFRCYRIIY
ncbi:hypothetical protein C2W64_04281 [Brevibacillus laterosporus]|nr:hypothetical protein C2W64_04281 [Brevibacillus laterosporus]